MNKPTHALLLSLVCGLFATSAVAAPQAPEVAVGPQYGTTHVYVAPNEFAPFVKSLLATFGGTTSKRGIYQVTPTPSRTISQLVLTPAGTFSVFGFKTPVPYPFGIERNGYLVSDMATAVREARQEGADILVSTFPDAIGRDTIIQWPGGVNMQLYWHTTPPHYATLTTIPENRFYVSKVRADTFLRDYLAFSHGRVVSDDRHAPGIEIGKPRTTYRRVRIDSRFGKAVVLVTDGHLPWPYGRELTDYAVKNLTATLAKAKAVGVQVLVPAYVSDKRVSAMVEFPGGYIAEIHSSTR